MKYQDKKEQVRQEAIDWQMKFNNQKYGYLQLAEFSDYFSIMGKRYGLLKEFRENGII